MPPLRPPHRSLPFWLGAHEERQGPRSNQGARFLQQLHGPDHTLLHSARYDVRGKHNKNLVGKVTVVRVVTASPHFAFHQIFSLKDRM
ncbi:hypothetical protein NDU88_001627 [Pleurodeles waltl]|uniref:Uncharacterized protein n=1 Tax=Pleurodeles waltl TaxID=8319 RepID=A0AAV7WPX9_PLEWA|nr:hypothetical protein NDU88_001627 [Pleurodeles waltl]